MPGPGASEERMVDNRVTASSCYFSCYLQDARR